MKTRWLLNALIPAAVAVLAPAASAVQEIAAGDVYSVIELAFGGPVQTLADAPARDVEFWVEFVHESGAPTFKVHGFWDGDGDGKGGAAGGVFKVRFCPTREGHWRLARVRSNAQELAGQHQGDFVTAAPSTQPGFWLPDPDSAGGRWYKRSNGAHQYIFGNTHYSFLSGHEKDGKPSGNDIAADVEGNARYFKKLRFGLSGDYYPDPKVKPFLDDDGKPTDWGDYSHRPNPRWFRERVDVAVRAAWRRDLIADLILAGPDREESRSTLRARHNGGDPAPFLRYIAARYGSFPNVWICLCNEYDIRTPTFSEERIIGFGQTIQRFLPYPTPLSVHATPRKSWVRELDARPWHDHHIIQKKIRELASAADIIQQTWANGRAGKPRFKPTVNDELSYQGQGDKHSEGDTIESHLGAFLGGGYATTGEKPGSKIGQYFRGKFDAREHGAADNLKFLRETIDAHVTFWKMAPDLSAFSNLDPGFRGLAWPGEEYVLGANQARPGLVAKLPEGAWTVKRYDVIAKKETTLAADASDRFTFDAPASRAVLFHFKRNR